MNEFLAFVLSLLGGIGLSLFFFGGLWWTVQQLQKKNGSNFYLFVSSFIVRLVLTLAGFYLIGLLGWQWVLVALLAFAITRFVFVQRFKNSFVEAPTSSSQEVERSTYGTHTG
jgi:F1F0 ATPase subunit 2